MIEQHENNFFLVHQGEKHKLKVGDLLTVPWGKTGKQLACIVKINEGVFHIKRYKANSGKWSKVARSLSNKDYEKTEFSPGQFANRGLLVNSYNLGALIQKKND
tara:strand:+ start:643 stop:954 length:312 start_codon:yes stop_codon:yes gene_type:complete